MAGLAGVWCRLSSSCRLTEGYLQVSVGQIAAVAEEQSHLWESPNVLLLLAKAGIGFIFQIGLGVYEAVLGVEVSKKAALIIKAPVKLHKIAIFSQGGLTVVIVDDAAQCIGVIAKDHIVVYNGVVRLVKVLKELTQKEFEEAFDGEVVDLKALVLK